MGSDGDTCAVIGIGIVLVVALDATNAVDGDGNDGDDGIVDVAKVDKTDGREAKSIGEVPDRLRRRVCRGLLAPNSDGNGDPIGGLTGSAVVDDAGARCCMAI